MEIKSELQQRLEMVIHSQQARSSKTCAACGIDIWMGLGDDPTVISFCYDCSQKNWEMAHPERRLHEIGIPIKYKDSSLDNFRGNDRLVEKMLKISNESPVDILISGPCGCGKTHIVSAIIRKMVEAGRLYRKHTMFLPVIEFMLEVKSTFSNNQESEQDVVDRYSKPSLLVLDDLGAEKTSEWTAATLYALIDRRYRDGKKTFITTNLTLEQIEQQLGSRIASRLSEYIIININMPDFRKKR